MGTPRTIAFVGLRTAPATGWRADIARAGALLVDNPLLWLIGMIGFALRGGVLFLVAPIIVLPTQVEVRLLLGGNLGSTGLEGGFFVLVGAATVITFGVALSILYVLARVERAGFGMVVGPPSVADGAGRRRATTGELYVVQALALLALLLAAVPLAIAVGDATLAEILRPSSSASIYDRVAGAVVPQLFLFAVAIVVVELLSALATRSILMRANGIKLAGTGRPAAFVRLLVAHPLRNLAVAIAGWLLFVLVVVIGIWAIDMAWQATSAVFLSVSWSSAVEQVVAQSAGAFVLAAVFGLALLAGGLTSAIRCALWSLASLR